MAKYKYTNLNRYSIGLPTKNGSDCTFNPGDGTNDPWFSRFCRKDYLTDTSARYSPQEASKPALPPRPQPRPVHESPMVKKAGIVLETDHKFYKKESGIYTCKLCERGGVTIFRTGSSLSIEAHLFNFHQVGLEDAPPAVPSAPQQAQAVPDASKVAPITPSVHAAPPAGKVKQVFECAQCGSKFASAKGLKLHGDAKHPVPQAKE